VITTNKPSICTKFIILAGILFVLTGEAVSNPVFIDSVSEREMNVLYDSMLAQWSLPYTSVYVKTDIGRTHVIMCGDSGLPALMLLHGAWLNATMWLKSIPFFLDHFYIIAVDIPGDIGKSVLENKSCAIRNGEQAAWWYQQVLDSLGITRANILGISMGAWFAMQIASRSPELVVATAVYAPMGLNSFHHAQRALFKTIIFKPKNLHLNLLMEALAGADNPAMLPFRHQYEIAMKSHPLLPKLRRIPARQLRKIKGGTFITLGGHDILMGNVRKVEDRATKYIPNATVKVLPQQEHVMTLDASKELLQEILGFFLKYY
jgi:pimeloyl-ACP methyl ester carboxylesterase